MISTLAVLYWYSKVIDIYSVNLSTFCSNYLGNEERLEIKNPAVLNHWGRLTPTLSDIEKIKLQQVESLKFLEPS